MGKKLNITIEEEKQIIDKYVNGLSMRVIASEHDISAPSVKKILEKYSIDARKKKGLKHCVHHRTIDLSVWKDQEGSAEFDYLIGILATDGCITGTQIAAEFAENNKEILDHYNQFLGNRCNINSRYCPKRRNTYYSLKYKNEDIVKYLASFGIVPRKTKTVKLKYINWNVLRGIFDGDGSIIRDPRVKCSFKFKITSGSIDFIEQIADFYRENDIEYYINTESGPTGNSWINITVGKTKDIYKIYCEMYKDSPFFLNRKKEKFGPIVEKFTNSNSVNSVNEIENSKTEPSLTEEGAETRNGEPKSE